MKPCPKSAVEEAWSTPEKMLSPVWVLAPLNVLLSESSVDDAALPLLPTHTLLTEKHPAERLTPPAKLEVAVPITAKFVVVALVVVEWRAVKSCSVELAYAVNPLVKSAVLEAASVPVKFVKPENTLAPEKVLLFARSVVDAAPIVWLPPKATEMPLIVTDEFWS